MTQVKATRQAAIKAAQDALMERVKTNPAKVLDTIMSSPQLLAGVHDVDVMFDVMLEAGLHQRLLTLASQKGFPKYLLPVLVGKLL